MTLLKPMASKVHQDMILDKQNYIGPVTVGQRSAGHQPRCFCRRTAAAGTSDQPGA